MSGILLSGKRHNRQQWKVQ